jgi:hypothetical protein
MMEAARTYETLVNVYQTTWRNNPEDSHESDKMLGSELLTALKKSTVILMGSDPCGPPMRPHGATTQKTAVDKILSDV